MHCWYLPIIALTYLKSHCRTDLTNRLLPRTDRYTDSFRLQRSSGSTAAAQEIRREVFYALGRNYNWYRKALREYFNSTDN